MFVLNAWPKSKGRRNPTGGRPKIKPNVKPLRRSSPDPLDALLDNGCFSEGEFTTARWYETMYWKYCKAIEAPTIRKSKSSPLPASGPDWSDAYKEHLWEKWSTAQNIIRKCSPKAANEMHKVIIMKTIPNDIREIKKILNTLEKEMMV